MIGKWDGFFLLMMTLPIMGHIVILPLMLDVAGRDAWISVFFALPVGLLLMMVIYLLKVKHPDKDFYALSCHLLGNGFGKVFVVIFSVYFFFLSSLSFAALADMVIIAFLPETPMWVIILSFFLIIVYAAWKGIKAIALTAGFLSFLAVMTGITVASLDAKLKEFANITPILEFGWTPSLWGGLVLMSVWMEISFLLMIPVHNIREKGLFSLWIIGIIANGFIMLGATTAVIMVFGLGLADNFTYPTLEIVRIIGLGFIDRFDIYGLILMSFGCYIRCSLYLRLSYNLMVPKVKLGPRMQKGLFCIWALFFFLASYYLAKNHSRLEEYINYYAYGVALYPVLILLLGLSFMKERRTSME